MDADSVRANAAERERKAMEALAKPAPQKNVPSAAKRKALRKKRRR
jgi:hypothetical protein